MIHYHLSISSSSNITIFKLEAPFLVTLYFIRSRLLPSSHPGTSTGHCLGASFCHPCLMRPPFLVHHILLILGFPPPHGCFGRRDAHTWGMWDLISLKMTTVYLCNGSTVCFGGSWVPSHLPSFISASDTVSKSFQCPFLFELLFPPSLAFTRLRLRVECWEHSKACFKISNTTIIILPLNIFTDFYRERKGKGEGQNEECQGQWVTRWHIQALGYLLSPPLFMDFSNQKVTRGWLRSWCL